jgi:hypothetical protein
MCWNLKGYCIAIPKPGRKAILSWKYFVNTMGWIILVQVIKRVLFMPIITQCMCNTPFKVYKKSLGCIPYLLKCGGVLHSHTTT